MLDNVSYDKIKLLHELSCMIWFLEKHALKDAQAAGDTECYDLFVMLNKDLQKHIEKIRGSVCMVSQ